MPMGAEPVYQPTTVSVSYEPRPGRNNGNRSLFSRLINTPRFQLFMCIYGLLAVPLGLALTGGAVASLRSDYIPQTRSNDEVAENPVITCYKMPVILIFIGSIFVATGLLSLGVYITVLDCKRNRICQCSFFDKKKSLSRQMQCHNGGGCAEGILALNPSTDPLVSHTKGSESTHRCDEEERRNLMPDSKDCLSSAEESDRMLEPDPRIVLRPIGRLDDA